MNKAIVFSFLSQTLTEHQDDFTFVNKTYNTYLKYTFVMSTYDRINANNEFERDNVEIVVVLSLQDGAKLDKKMPRKAAMGLRLLSQKCTQKYFISYDNMPDVDWGKQAETE